MDMLSSNNERSKQEQNKVVGPSNFNFTTCAIIVLISILLVCIRTNSIFDILDHLNLIALTVVIEALFLGFAFSVIYHFTFEGDYLIVKNSYRTFKIYYNDINKIVIDRGFRGNSFIKIYENNKAKYTYALSIAFYSSKDKQMIRNTLLSYGVKNITE